MKFNLLALSLACAVCQSAMADGPSAKSYIIQLQESAVQAPPRAPLPDARQATDPQGWGYLDVRVMDKVQQLERTHGIKAEHAYSRVLKGFSAVLTPNQLARLKADPTVKAIEEDQPVQVSAQSIPWGITMTRDTLSSTLAGNGNGTVQGPTVYIIDTGIAAHPELNIVSHVNFVGDRKNYDCNGHGTHVSGTVGAKDDTAGVVGMAPGVRLAGVKVLDCKGSGSTSTVIKGVDWVTANAIKPAVANLSLGGSASSLLDSAVSSAVTSGVVVTIAAGNGAVDACTQSPARIGGALAGAITIGATDTLNAEASFSNYGNCVDIWAPGVNVSSTYLSKGYATLSGTSMGSPHAAGAAALYLSHYPSAPPAEVETAIRQAAVPTGTVSKDGRPITRLDTIGF